MMDEVSIFGFNFNGMALPFTHPSLCCVGVVSYQEFLGMFRKDTKKLVKQLTGMAAMMKSEDGLVGIDAKIPGGACDPSVKNGKL